jgi:hypothetical protein
LTVELAFPLLNVRVSAPDSEREMALEDASGEPEAELTEAETDPEDLSPCLKFDECKVTDNQPNTYEEEPS